MRCYCKILRVSYKDHVTNEEVRAKIQQAIGPHEDLLNIEKRRKLQWYEHVSRSSGLAKTILQSTVKGGRRQGRQRKRWEDNIRELTGLEFAKSQRAVENRDKWRLAVKSSVMPQRPSRSRDDEEERGRRKRIQPQRNLIRILSHFPFSPGKRHGTERHRHLVAIPRIDLHAFCIYCLYFYRRRLTHRLRVAIWVNTSKLCTLL